MTMPQKVKDTNIFERAAGFSRPRLRGRILISMMTLASLFATRPQNLAAYQDAQGSPQSVNLRWICLLHQHDPRPIGAGAHCLKVGSGPTGDPLRLVYRCSGSSVNADLPKIGVSITPFPL